MFFYEHINSLSTFIIGLHMEKFLQPAASSTRQPLVLAPPGPKDGKVLCHCPKCIIQGGKFVTPKIVELHMSSRTALVSKLTCHCCKFLILYNSLVKSINFQNLGRYIS